MSRLPGAGRRRARPGWLADQFEQCRSHWLCRLRHARFGQLAAARHADFEAPLEVLAPDVVLHFDLGPGRIAEMDLVCDPAKLRHLAIQR